MKYCAVYNTADPKIGAVSVGEVLEDWQVKALGDSKVARLVAEGLLKKIHDAPEAESAMIDDSTNEHQSNGEEAKDDQGNEAEETEDAIEDDEEDAVIPELDDMEDIIQDQEPEAETDKPSKRGRRKKADEGTDSENRQG